MAQKHFARNGDMNGNAGSWNPSASFSIENHKQKLLSELNHAHASLRVAIDAFKRADGGKNIKRHRAVAQRAVLQLKNVAARTKAELEQMADATLNAETEKRHFQSGNDIYRPIQKPSLFVTSALLSIGWTLETAFTAISLFADGHMGLVPSMAFASVFASVNVGLGLACGFGIRYWGGRISSSKQSSSQRLRSKLARWGVGAAAAIHGLMNFAAGRVRVTGGHDDIFNFADVGLFETFGDGLALIIMVAAALSFIVATFKGYSGLYDPEPEYQLYAEKGAGISENVQDRVDDALKDLEDILADAEDELEEISKEHIAFEELPTQIADFNADVQDAILKHTTFVSREQEKSAFVHGFDTRPLELDFGAFDALRINLEHLPDIVSDQSFSSEVADAHGDAVSTINIALEKYFGTVSEFRTPPNHV